MEIVFYICIVVFTAGKCPIILERGRPKIKIMTNGETALEPAGVNSGHVSYPRKGTKTVPKKIP